MKRLMIFCAAFLMAMPAIWAQQAAETDEFHAPSTPKKERTTAVGQELQNHFSFYGFIRDYFAYDTRESVAGTGDLFYYLPEPRDINSYGDDLNAVGSFRFLAITTRLGVDVSGYRVGRTDFGAKVETDFYSGVSGTTGTAQLRLRQAYMTIGWGDLPMCGSSDNKAYVKLTLGQAWHPIAADQPHVTSLETGAPFNAFSRTPQVLMDASLGKHFTISAAAIWQMQYASTGPDGKSADYIKYSGVPEMYLALSLKAGIFLGRVGASVTSIKPRNTGTVYDAELEKNVSVKVKDRMTGFNPYVYIQFNKNNFEFKAKTVYSQAGDYMNFMSGYGVCSMSADDGHWKYTPNQVSSTWASFSYGRKWQFMFMVGYIKNLGTTKGLVDMDEYMNYYSHEDKTADEISKREDNYRSSIYYYSSNGYPNMVSMWRVIPTIAYNVGKFTIALEYNMTSVRYGDESSYNKYGVANGHVHPVTNHRIQAMTKFTF